jgi:hypothetical protein
MDFRFEYPTDTDKKRIYLFSNHLNPLFLFFRFADQRNNIPEEYRGTDTGRGRGKSPVMIPRAPFSAIAFLIPGKHVSEGPSAAPKRGTRPFDQRLVYAKGSEKNAGNNINDQNLRWSKIGFYRSVSGRPYKEALRPEKP